MAPVPLQFNPKKNTFPFIPKLQPPLPSGHEFDQLKLSALPLTVAHGRLAS